MAYDEYGQWTPDLSTAPDVTTSDTGTTTYYPPDPTTADPAASGATQQDANGNWYDSLGNLVKQIAPLAGGALIALNSNNINNALSGGLQAKQIGYIDQGVSGLANITSPNLQALIPQLQKQVQQGTMTPAQAQAALQQASNMNNVNSDQQSLSAQREALNRLSTIGTSGGMTDADRAQLAADINQTNAAAAQNREAQIQQLQSQGLGGSGAELAARLAGGQQVANANANAGAGIAESAQARALAALQGNLAGNANLNSTLFQQEAQKAAAQDQINAFNAAAKNAVNQTNAANQQQANLTNFNTANTIAGKNTDISNQQAMLPLQTAQEQFTNNLAKGTALANADVAGAKALAPISSNNISTGNTAIQTASNGSQSTGGSSSSGSSGGKQIGSALGGIAGSVFGGPVGGAIGSTLGGFLGGLFKDGGEVTGNEDDELNMDDFFGKSTGYKYRYGNKPESKPDFNKLEEHCKGNK